MNIDQSQSQTRQSPSSQQPQAVIVQDEENSLPSSFPGLDDLEEEDALASYNDDDDDDDDDYDDNESSTDYSAAMSLTSHSGNAANRGLHDSEEWCIRVEDHTITISRVETTVLAPAQSSQPPNNDYDDDSFASSSSSAVSPPDHGWSTGSSTSSSLVEDEDEDETSHGEDSSGYSDLHLFEDDLPSDSNHGRAMEVSSSTIPDSSSSLHDSASSSTSSSSNHHSLQSDSSLSDMELLELPDDENENNSQAEKPHTMLVLCTMGTSVDSETRQRQSQTFELLHQHYIPYETLVVCSDDSEEEENSRLKEQQQTSNCRHHPCSTDLRDALFHLAGLTATRQYPQMFLCSADGQQTLYWGDAHSMVLASGAGLNLQQVLLWQPLADASDSHQDNDQQESEDEQEEPAVNTCILPVAAIDDEEDDIITAIVTEEGKAIQVRKQQHTREVDDPLSSQLPHSALVHNDDSELLEEDESSSTCQRSHSSSNSNPSYNSITAVQDDLPSPLESCWRTPIEAPSEVLDYVSVSTAGTKNDDLVALIEETEEVSKAEIIPTINDAVLETPKDAAIEEKNAVAYVSPVHVSGHVQEPESPTVSSICTANIISKPVAQVPEESITDEDTQVVEQEVNSVRANMALQVTIETCNEDILHDSFSTGKLGSSHGDRGLHARTPASTLFGNPNALLNVSPFQRNDSGESFDQNNPSKLTPSVKFASLDAMVSKIETAKQASKKKETKGEKDHDTKATIKQECKGPKDDVSGSASSRERNIYKPKTKSTDEAPKKSKVDTKGKAKTKAATASSKSRIVSTIKVQARNPALNCYEWYNRLGRPSRESMKRRVKQLHESCGVLPDHVDLLPWADDGSSLKFSGVRDLLLGKGLSVQ